MKRTMFWFPDVTSSLFYFLILLIQTLHTRCIFKFILPNMSLQSIPLTPNLIPLCSSLQVPCQIGFWKLMTCYIVVIIITILLLPLEVILIQMWSVCFPFFNNFERVCLWEVFLWMDWEELTASASHHFNRSSYFSNNANTPLNY